MTPLESVRGSHEQGTARSSRLCSGPATAHQPINQAGDASVETYMRKGEKIRNEERRREKK